MSGWLDALEARHAEVFTERDWHAHVSGLNQRLDLQDGYRFVESRSAPEFFWAAFPRFEPKRWLATISLNPREMSEENRAWHESVPWTADLAWRYHLREELMGFKPEDFYYRKWAYPFVILASTIWRDPGLLERPMETFFDTVGSFEVVPYASYQYATGTMGALRGDPGCEFAREITLTALTACPPAAILANGLDAVHAAAEWLPFVGALEERSYPSTSRSRSLRHWQGTVALDHGVRVPFVGFPFLRTQSGHNSYDEVRQLGQAIGALT